MGQDLGRHARELVNRRAEQQKREVAAASARDEQREVDRVAEIKANLQATVRHAAANGGRSLKIYERHLASEEAPWVRHKGGFWNELFGRKEYGPMTLPGYVQDLFNYCKDQGLSPEWEYTNSYQGPAGVGYQAPKVAMIISW